MDLVIETDIGRDPDDLMALCWLLSAGVNLKAVLISPGDADQVAVVRYFLRECASDALIGVSRPNRNRSSCTGFHRKLVESAVWPARMEPDGLGVDVLMQVFKNAPSTPCFACGPMDSFGQWLEAGGNIQSMTIQGGFCGYELHTPSVCVANFQGEKEVASFNLNGNLPAARAVFSNPGIRRRVAGRDILISHDGPVGESPELQPGWASVRRVLELSLPTLLLRGHAPWVNPLALLANDSRVLNLDARVIVLRPCH